MPSPALPGRRCPGKADGCRGATNKPPRTNQQIHGILEEGWTVPLDGVTNELKHPANQEQSERPTPFEEKQRQRNNNHGYADAVRKLVERMLVLCFVIFAEGFGHFV